MKHGKRLLRRTLSMSDFIKTYPLFSELMTMTNPYVENLVEMGYDRKDVETASTMFQKKTFPYTIHGRTYQTEEEYNEAIHEFMNGM